MNGVRLPPPSYWESQPRFISDEEKKLDREAFERAEQQIRLDLREDAKRWEETLRERLRNCHKSGEDRSKLMRLIFDAQWCQGPIFGIPRRSGFSRNG